MSTKHLLDNATEQGHMDDIITASYYILSFVFHWKLKEPASLFFLMIDELEDIVGFARKYLRTCFVISFGLYSVQLFLLNYKITSELIKNCFMLTIM